MYSRHEMMTGIMYTHREELLLYIYIHTVDSNKMLMYHNVYIGTVPHPHHTSTAHARNP